MHLHPRGGNDGDGDGDGDDSDRRRQQQRQLFFARRYKVYTAQESLLTLLLSAALVVLLDMDSAQVSRVGVRWRCYGDSLTLAMEEALATNWSGLGWSAQFVAPVSGNLTGCQELLLDGLQGARMVPPLAEAFAIGSAAPCAGTRRPKNRCA